MFKFGNISSACICVSLRELTTLLDHEDVDHVLLIIQANEIVRLVTLVGTHLQILDVRKIIEIVKSKKSPAQMRKRIEKIVDVLLRDVAQKRMETLMRLIQTVDDAKVLKKQLQNVTNFACFFRNYILK